MSPDFYSILLNFIKKYENTPAHFPKNETFYTIIQFEKQSTMLEKYNLESITR